MELTTRESADCDFNKIGEEMTLVDGIARKKGTKKVLYMVRLSKNTNR